MPTTRWKLLALLALTSACGDEHGGSGDAGRDEPMDAAETLSDAATFDDAAFIDAAFGDAAFGDAAFGDAAFGDAALGDAALGDAALGDAASGDAGLPDTGLSDAGRDAGDVCGDGRVSGSETCDGDCPAACDDGLVCTRDMLVGSAARCSAACSFTPITSCVDGDGCCPSGCSATFDDDCACVPTSSCAGRTCGTIDDGCGVTLRCGPDCRTWTRVTPPPVAPESSALFGLAHLAPGRVLYVDGLSGRSFEYAAATDSWTETGTAVVGSDALVRLAYAGNGRVVGIARSTGISLSTWEYDAATGTWTQYAPPPAYVGSDLAYAGTGRVLAFGTRASAAAPHVAATFLYNSTSHTWVELAIASQPVPRGQASLEWLGMGRVLLLGGLGNASGAAPVLDDAWVFNTATSTWTMLGTPASGGRYRDGVGHLATGVVVTYGGRGSSSFGAGSELFRRYEGGTDAWTATTSGALVTPGPLYANRLAHLSPGRVFMLEGVWGTLPSTRSRGWAWIYDEGTGSSDMAP